MNIKKYLIITFIIIISSQQMYGMQNDKETVNYQQLLTRITALEKEIEILKKDQEKKRPDISISGPNSSLTYGPTNMQLLSLVGLFFVCLYLYDNHIK